MIDYEVLRKYRDGRIVDEEDKEKIRQLSSVGLCTMGLAIEDGEFKGTSRTTPDGEYLLRQDRIIRSPWRRTLRALIVAFLY